MIKQIILPLLVIISLSSVVYSSPLSFIPLFSQLFETTHKRLNSNLCCLPETFSFQGVFSSVSQNGNVLSATNGSISFYGDYNLGKIRQEVSISPTGQPTPHILYTFKIGASLFVNYEILYGKCECVKYQSDFDWLCLPNQGNITKATIGGYSAKRIVIKNPPQQVESWVFHENPSQTEKCWVLNSYSVDPLGSDEEMYYNMVEKVDTNVFKLPAQCPPIEKCQSQT